MTAVETLRAARAKIAEGWCQGRYELTDDSGNPIAWCASGAISRVTGASFAESCAAYDVLVEAIGAGGHLTISRWNDTAWRTQADVLAMFDKAIGLAISRGE